MNIMAFDLGGHMAAVEIWDNGDSEMWHETFTECRPERLMRMQIWIRNRMRNAEESGCDAVIYETPFCRGEDATRILWAIAGLIEIEAERAGLPVVDRRPPVIKKWATGNGRASKEEMTARAKELGYLGDNEHEADAYLLAMYGRANIRRK